MDRAAAEVLTRAEMRAAALARADGPGLRDLLHPAFRWTAHTGASFDRETYVRANTSGQTVWRAQTLVAPEVVVVADTAVLRCTVVDEVGTSVVESFKMPMTQVWVRHEQDWVCLAGHAGPRLSDG